MARPAPTTAPESCENRNSAPVKGQVIDMWTASLATCIGMFFRPIGVVTGAIRSVVGHCSGEPAGSSPEKTHGAPGSCCAMAVAEATVHRCGGSRPA